MSSSHQKPLRYILLVICLLTTSGANFYRAPEIVRPFLFEPCKENIDLSDKTTLTFRWRPEFYAYVKAFDFRLYKGFKTTHQNLIWQTTLPADQRSFHLDISFLEDGKQYAWELRQIYRKGTKSEEAHCLFTLR